MPFTGRLSKTFHGAPHQSRGAYLKPFTAPLINHAKRKGEAWSEGLGEYGCFEDDNPHTRGKGSRAMDSEGEEPSQAARPQGKGKKSRGRRAEALVSDNEEPQLDIDLQSSSEEAEPTIDVKSWPLEKVLELKALLVQIEEKEGKERPALATFQDALRAVPGEVLEGFALKKLTADLLKKSRYPRAENTKKIAAAVGDMVAQAEELHAAQAER